MFGDVAGNFLPYDRDTDSTTINPTANDAIPTTFDEFTVKMHFSKDGPKKTANLKFDYVIGELEDPAVMDGLSFMAAKRCDPALADIPVIAMTAATWSCVEGAIALLRKPFDLDAFLADVARCLGSQSAR